MSEQILTTLKRKLDDLAAYGELDAETRRNALKEELQFYVLNFIYHHPEYSKWIMYGGSALRVCHGLERMSVDLDFEVAHSISEKFLEKLKKEIEKYFINTYGTDPKFLTIKITTGRGLLLKFHIGEELSIGHPSKQVHVKIDFNHFTAPKTVTERRPINQDQLSFVITTYNMSALMASKIAAIFLRRTRGVGEKVYEEKGRDIYDLLWYMTKKVVPDFDYLIATTAKLGRDYNISRSPISPEQLAEKLSDLDKKSKLGIIIGRESTGLNNEEISICDFTVTIPTSKDYGTMNISHAATIIMYELFKQQNKENITSHIIPITEKEKEHLYKILEESMKKMNFTTEEKKNTQRTLWKKIIGKSFLSKREAFALMGFLKKIK